MRNFICSLILGVAGVVSGAEVDLSLNSMDATLSKVAVHAQRFPPTFSSASERQEIERILKSAIIILDSAVLQYPAEPDLWFRDGYANAMGHNLDFPGCDRQFYKAFKRFLELRPNDKKGNYYFGAFLAATATRQDECVPYLKKATDLGVTDAHHALAFYYLTKKDKQKALYHLKEYAKANPGDEGIQAEIKKIMNSNIKIQKRALPTR